METLEIIGRIILGGFFIISGMNHFTQKEKMVAFTRDNRLPMPHVSVIISGLGLILGGLGILFWIQPQLASAGMAIFLMLVSFSMHRFWSLKNAAPEVRMNQIHFFTANMALFGALLLIVTLSGGLL